MLLLGAMLCSVRLTECADDPLASGSNECITTLEGHLKRVSELQWHPHANGLVASSSSDRTVQIWDVQTGTSAICLDDHTDLIQNMR